MTGAGKTYTMMGDMEGEFRVKGLYSYTIEDIFGRIEVCEMHALVCVCVFGR